MDRQQVLDLMATRDYCLYTEITDDLGHRLFFNNMSHPVVALEVRWFGGDDVRCRFRYAFGVVTLGTIWFDLKHEKFKSQFQAEFMRVLINLGVLS
jgi:hypothetical protein